MSNAARQAVGRLIAAVVSGDLAKLCSRSEIQLLVLFGSANLTDSEPHDVDLALRFERESPRDVLALLNQLYRLTGYETFDVLDLGRARPLARERALVGGRVLHESRPGCFANEQIAAIMQRLDTDHMRQVELELMSR